MNGVEHGVGIDVEHCVANGLVAPVDESDGDVGPVVATHGAPLKGLQQIIVARGRGSTNGQKYAVGAVDGDGSERRCRREEDIARGAVLAASGNSETVNGVSELALGEI